MKAQTSCWIALLALGGLLAGPSLSAQRSAEPLALTNANVVDVGTGQIAANVTVVLRDGRIASIGNPPPPGVRTLDLGGRYLLPGLVDAHTHLSNRLAAERALVSGVTTVRSSGVSHFWDVGLRELVKRGYLPGPDMVATGYHVRRRIADEAFFDDPSLGDLLGGLRRADDLRRVVRMNLAHGVDWIKVLATERAGTPDTDPRQPMFTEEELKAVVDEAATKKIPVQAHAHGDEGAQAAVRAGVRSIEHGTYLSDTTLTLMKERGTFLVPTYSTVIDLIEPGGDYDQAALQIRGRHMLARLRSTVQRAHRLGVKIVTGADTSYGPASVTRIAQEVVNFVEIGLPPLAAIQAATLTAAELLGMTDRIGTIKPGLEADLIVVDGNPLEDVRVLEDVLLVVSNGHVVVDRLELARRGHR